MLHIDNSPCKFNFQNGFPSHLLVVQEESKRSSSTSQIRKSKVALNRTAPRSSTPPTTHSPTVIEIMTSDDESPDNRQEQHKPANVQRSTIVDDESSNFSDDESPDLNRSQNEAAGLSPLKRGMDQLHGKQHSTDSPVSLAQLLSQLAISPIPVRRPVQVTAKPRVHRLSPC